jgi:hypothetical protein
MGKNKKEVVVELNTRPASVTKQEVLKRLNAVRDHFKVTKAVLRDGFCDYAYDVIKGIGAPDDHVVKGRNLFRDDLQNAFNQLRVHLAVVDNALNIGEAGNINDYHVDDIANKYEVTGLEIKGLGDNQSIIIIGNKYLGALGRMDLKTPRISMEASAGYKWYNELTETVELIREEVSLYKEGYYTPTETEETKENKKQIKMFGKNDSEEEVMEEEEDLEAAKV